MHHICICAPKNARIAFISDKNSQNAGLKLPAGFYNNIRQIAIASKRN